jgi:hypothetical protein
MAFPIVSKYIPFWQKKNHEFNQKIINVTFCQNGRVYHKHEAPWGCLYTRSL